MTSPIKFGTDGWRAIIADTFTFENVRIAAQATADYFDTLKSRRSEPYSLVTMFASFRRSLRWPPLKFLQAMGSESF